ncbi:MAG: DUF1559 domain-containing protein [Planctomycetota bacterium]
MNWFKCVSLSSLIVLAVGSSLSSDANADEGFGKRLPESTVAVIYVDVAALDVEGIASVFPADASKAFKSQVSPVVEMLRNAGIEDFYCTLDLASLIPPKPVFITTQGVKDAGILKQLMGPALQGMYGEQFVFESQLIDGRSHTGTPKGLKRFLAPKSVIDLSKSLESDLDHVVLLQWKKETAETLGQFWPPSIPINQDITIKPAKLAGVVERVVLEFSLPPSESARLSVVPRDRSDADWVASELDQLMRFVQQQTGLEIVRSDDASSLVWELGAGQTKLLTEYMRSARKSAQKAQKMNNVKQVMLAMHNHYSAFNELPRDIANGDNQLLSWRVKILPFIDQNALYQSLDVKQEWDSTKNKPLSEIVVPVYSDLPTGKTIIRLPKCEGSLWSTPGKLTFDKVLDGTSNTIAVVIAPDSSAVPWSEPGYMVLDEGDLVGSLFGERDKLIAGFVDGSVQVLDREKITEETLRALLTIAGGEVIQR